MARSPTMILSRPEHDGEDEPISPPTRVKQTFNLLQNALSLSPGSSSVQSSASDLKLMLLMDPYGLMDVQPTKLQGFSSNSTAPTESDMDSLTYGLPSVLGTMSASGSEVYEEEEYFDPYNTNIYGTTTVSTTTKGTTAIGILQKELSSSSLSIDATSLNSSVASSATRLQEAKQEASFYLEQTVASPQQEDTLLLFNQADEKATRLLEAKKDIAFYLQEQFHDAQQEDSSDEEENEQDVDAPLEDFQDSVSELASITSEEEGPAQADQASPLPMVAPTTTNNNNDQEDFQDCQDDASVEHASTASSSNKSTTSSKSNKSNDTNVEFYLQEQVNDDNEVKIDLKQEAENDFYLQQEALQDEVIDLETEVIPTIEKIASTTHRIDMDGAIRNKTVFYGDGEEKKQEEEEQEIAATLIQTKSSSFEDESGWSSASSTPTSSHEQQEQVKPETKLPLHIPVPPVSAAAPTPEALVEEEEEEESSAATMSQELNQVAVTRVSLDKYITARVQQQQQQQRRVFSKPQQVSLQRKQITIQRIDMAGILQPTQIYGPFLDQPQGEKETRSSGIASCNNNNKAPPPEVDSHAFSAALSTTLKQDLKEHNNNKATGARRQQQQEQVGCGCGWSYFSFFKRR